MTYPWILWRYIARNYIAWFSSVFLIIMVIIGIFETVELFRRSSGKSYINFIVILKMVILKLPMVVEQVLPLIIFFSCFLCIRALNKKLEIIVMRSIGISMIQIVVPFLAVASIFSLVYLFIFNPLSSTMFSRFERLESKFFKSQQDALSISNSGLWFKKTYNEEKVIVHSKKASKKSPKLEDITIYLFDKDNNFRERLDAKEAIMKKNELILQNPWVAKAKDWSKEEKSYRNIFIDLSLASLEESLASPKSIPFYKLQRFIESMSKMGFSVTAHRGHRYRLLGAPFLYLAMILWAAALSLRWQRQEKSIKIIGIACIAVFSLYIFNEVIRSLGLSGVVSPGWSVILSIGITFFSGCGLLLHLQEK